MIDGVSIGGIIVGGGAISVVGGIIIAILKLVTTRGERQTDNTAAMVELANRFARDVADSNSNLYQQIAELRTEVDDLRDVVGELRDHLRTALPIVAAAGVDTAGMVAALRRRNGTPAA